MALPPRPIKPEPRELRLQREVVRVARGALEVAGADHVGARLEGDVHERRLPAIAVVRRRGDVDLDARLVEREAGERHVVLPADEAAEAAQRRLDRAQAAAVSLAPDEPLVVRRHELAMLERELAVGAVVEKRVVERARAARARSRRPRSRARRRASRAISASRSPPGPGNLDGLAREHGERRLRLSGRPSRRGTSPSSRTGTRARTVSGKTTSSAPAAAASAVSARACRASAAGRG